MHRTRSARDSRTRGDRGASAVEFALIAPLVLLLVFGLIQYGFYFAALQGGEAAAREAARRAAVGVPTSCSTFRSEVEANIGAFDTGGLDIRRDYADPNANSRVDVGEDVTVTVVFQSYDLNIPFVPFIDNGVVTQSATTRVDYLPDPAIADCL